MKPMKNTLFLATAVAGLATAGTASATVVNIQFDSHQGYNAGSFSGQKGAYTGDSVASPIWNVASVSAGPTSGSMSSLVASNGGVTADGVRYSFQGSYSSAPTSPNNNLLRGHISSVSGYGQSVTLTGLTDNGSYQLYLYGADGSYNNGGTKFSFNAGTGTAAAGSNTYTSAPATASGTFQLNANYVIFNVTASATGTLGIVDNPLTGTPSYSNPGNLNGLQLISSVPEPATLGMMTVVGAGLLLARRRRTD